MAQIYGLDNVLPVSVIGSPLAALLITSTSGLTAIPETIATVPAGLMVASVGSAGFQYTMQALPGSSLAGSVWRIQRRGDLSGLNLTQWASGNAQFDKVANDFGSFPYS